MLFKKTRFPELNETVICTVKKVLPHSVFCELDEYTKEGMIHISEIAPGRIRNIRDFVIEGRKVTCKILSIDREKAHINLSLRRVTQSQKIKKQQEFKQEERAAKLLENTIQGSRGEQEKIAAIILGQYDSLTQCFSEVITHNLNLSELNLDKKLADKLTAVIKEKIKPPEVHMKSKLFLESFQPDGITHIKKILESIKKLDPEISILYLGAPSYKLDLFSRDYKAGESRLKKVTESTEKLAKQLHCKAKFERQEK